MSEVAKPNTLDSPLRYYGWLLLLYTLNHGWVLLLSGAIFWDDWILYGVPASAVLERFKQAGLIWSYPFGWVHVLLLEVGPWLYRFLTFGLMFGSGVALDHVLRRHRHVSAKLRCVIVLLFLILPLYWARVALIDIHYTICYFLFFLAWAMPRSWRIPSLILFILSFSTNSLLFFFVIPFADMCLRSMAGRNGAVSAARAAARHVDFAILPIVFFGIKYLWFRPYGAYAGYNEEVAAKNLLLQPLSQWNDLIATCSEAIGWCRVSMRTSLSLQFVMACAAVTTVLLVISLSRRTVPRLPAVLDKTVNVRCGVGVFGLVVTAIGAFPYWLVGKAPVFNDWGSRHQLLLPLGVAITLAVFLTDARRNKQVAMAVVVCVCTFVNTYAYMGYVVDWSKQRQLISLLRESPLVAQARVVLFADETPDLNARGRRYRYYEWCGIVSAALGGGTRIGADATDMTRLRQDSGRVRRQLALSPVGSCEELFSGDPLEAVQVTVRSEPPMHVEDRLSRFGLARVSLVVEPIAPITFELEKQDEAP